MKRVFLLTLCVIGLCGAAAAQVKSWQGIQDLSAKEMQQHFQLPPVEFASHILWGWEGDMNAAIMKNDLDLMQQAGTRVVNIEPGYNFPYEYLSDGWFKMIKAAVKEAKKRNMKVWLIDDAKYPSGFAGGLFSRERPDLKMWALVSYDDKLEVPAGTVLRNYEVPAGAVSAVAVSSGRPNRTIEIADGHMDFSAGTSDWTVIFAGYAHKSGDTRAVNLESRGKDTTNFLHDHLNPAAVDQFIRWTHEAAAKALGDELGRTVLGFRGDEPEYMYTPWTPAMTDTFMLWKGYDPTPYLASFFAPQRTEFEKRVKADYWDVWSRMFADHFFKRQADWCEAHGMAHITHLNNEHIMPVCVDADGDFFRVLNRIQIPGVDVISNHVAPGVDNDFPKLASSVSHMYGKPRAFSETMGAVSGGLQRSKYVINHQIARGINHFEYNFWSSKSVTAESLAGRPDMKPLADYINRMSYLFSAGVPGARVLMYYPIMSMWLGNNAVYWHLSDLSQMLLRHQVDFDYADDDAFAEALKVGSGYLENLSGQKYNTLVIPFMDVMSETAFNRIAEFLASGGKVLFWGGRPSYLVGKTFTELKPFPDLPGAVYEPLERWTPAVAAAMPEPELAIEAVRPEGGYLSGPTDSRYSILSPDALQAQIASARAPRSNNNNGGAQRQRSSTLQAWVTIASIRDRMGLKEVVLPTDSIRYTHRVLSDGDLYFVFNEGVREQTFTVVLDAVGRVSAWDGFTGTVTEIPFEVVDGKTRVELTIGGYDSKVLTLTKSNKEFNVKDFGAIADGETVTTSALQKAADAAHRNGGGIVVVPAGRYLTGALFFKDGVDLRIEKGATLVSTVDSDDFPVISTRFEGEGQQFRCALLNFDRSRRVRVYGGGAIEGRGQEWSNTRNKDGHWGRPRMLCFTACDGGSISDLTMTDHASWCLHVLYTHGFDISDLHISVTSYVPSSDGVDIDSSSDVTVRNVFFKVTDDCISVKSGKNEDGRRVGLPSMNILVEDCVMQGGGGVAMGSEISGGIRNVIVRRCRCTDVNGVRFKSQPSRGGTVENITFEDITLENAATFISANLIWRMVEDYAPYSPRTQLRNIVIRNIQGTARTAGSIVGDPEQPIPAGAFTFENCRIEAERGLSIANIQQTSFPGLDIHVASGDPVYTVNVAYGGRSSGTPVQ